MATRGMLLLVLAALCACQLAGALIEEEAYAFHIAAELNSGDVFDHEDTADVDTGYFDDEDNYYDEGAEMTAVATPEAYELAGDDVTDQHVASSSEGGDVSVSSEGSIRVLAKRPPPGKGRRSPARGSPRGKTKGGRPPPRGKARGKGGGKRGGKPNPKSKVPGRGGPKGKVGCFKKSYGRGVGKVNLNCKWMPGGVQDAGLCYKACPKGWKGVGPICWQGAKSQGRGAGQPMKPDCGGGQNDAGLCYKKCGPGSKGVGPVCWGNCGGRYSQECGAFCVAPGKCPYVTGRMGKQAFNVAMTMLKAGKCAVATAATLGAASPCLASVVKSGVNTGMDLKKFFADEMDGVCR